MTGSVDIVIPVYNEAETVPDLIERLRAACPEAQLIFVDNGSTDGTLALLEGRSDVTLVKHAENLGYGRSIMDGIRASSGDLIVMIDADLEYHPEDVPAVIEALDRAPAVYGSRFADRKRSDWVMPAARRVGNAVVTSLFNGLFHQHLTDLYTGLRAVRREVLPEGGLTRPGFEMVLELAARLAARGVSIAEVPIGYTARTRGTSKMRHIPEFLKFARSLLELKVELKG